MNVKEKDQMFFGRGGPAMELEMTKALGSIIYDQHGERYIDFLGGAGVGIFGWGNSEIEAAIRRSERPSYVYPYFYYKPWADLAQRIVSITPEHLTKVFRTTGGSEAVEAAMQIAMMYTKRKKFLSIEGSYHGNTLGALSIASSSNKQKFPGLLPGCDKIDLPLDDNALKKIEKQLESNEVAAFIMEPVIINLGVIIPEKDFMQKLQELCKKHGTLLVMDEVISGFGRTGKLFATEAYDIKPDIMCLAKAMSAGHAGIGATVISDEIAEVVQEKVGLYSTYGWHPLSVDAAMASIKLLVSNKEDIFSNISEISEIFRNRLAKIKFSHQPDIRIRGMAIGVDLKNKDYVTKLKEKCFKEGLLFNTEGSSLTFLPALNIEKEIVEKGLEILEKCA